MEAEHWNGSDGCEIARASASAAMDGEGALDAHVESCAACQEYVAELRATSARFAVLREETEADLWPGIAARVRAADPARRRHRQLARLAAAGIGFAATTLALRGLGARTHDLNDGTASTWAAALRPEAAEPHGLAASPERQLLAALDRMEERR